MLICFYHAEVLKCLRICTIFGYDIFSFLLHICTSASLLNFFIVFGPSADRIFDSVNLIYSVLLENYQVLSSSLSDDHTLREVDLL